MARMTVGELRQGLADVPDDVFVNVNLGYPHEDIGTDKIYEHVDVFSYSDGSDSIEIFVPVDEDGTNVDIDKF